MTDAKWLRPQHIDDAPVFPAIVVGVLMPEYTEVPKAFRTRTSESAQWYDFQAQWFSHGLSGVGVHPSESLVEQVVTDAMTGEEARAALQEEIDRAFKHLGAVQGSFQPKHEHKMAAVAWLASLWFGEVHYDA